MVLNDQIKGVGTLSSILCKKTNVYTLFNKHQRRKRSHGKRHYNKKPLSQSPVWIPNNSNRPALESTNTDFSSAEYRGDLHYPGHLTL